MEENKQFEGQQVVIVPQMSLKEWLITLIILAVPIVNFIMMFIWAFDPMSGRRNFARANLIVTGVMLALMIIFMTFMFILGISIGILSS